MKRTVLICCLLILAALNAPAQQNEFPQLTGPSLEQNPQAAPSTICAGLERLAIDAFFDESYKRQLLRYPEYITNLGLEKLLGSGNDRLNDLSAGYLQETQELERTVLELLRRYDRSKLTPAQRLTADIYDWYLDDRVHGQAFTYSKYPITPTGYSIHIDLLQFFTDIHPVRTTQEAQDYVTRLSQVRTKFDQIVDGLKRRERAGVVLPGFLIKFVLNGVNALVQSSPTHTPFYSAFAKKVEALSHLLDAKKRALLAAAERQIAISVIPGYKLLVEYLQHQLTVASNDAGIWKQPNGAAYYAYQLRHHTTTDLSADQIHEMGKNELERIHADMRQGFALLGYDTNQSLPTLYQRLAQDGGMVSGVQIVAAYEQIIRRAENKLSAVFDLKPRAKVIVDGGASGGYYIPPAMDGSRPGVFYAQNKGEIPRYNMASLAYHEAVPGHHFQLAIAQELNLPLLRRDMDYTAHVEGWALYAERLAKEMGLYADDPHGDLGRLQYEAFRAARLVVDTGLHAKRWTFDQAVDFMEKNTGMPRNMMLGEVVRYASVPGQATAYCVGFLKILELRDRARAALGERFDLKEFHNVLLANGTLPLAVLEKLVDAYIQDRKDMGTQFSEFPKLTGPYLGQKPPGTTPEIFAPGIVSTGMSESTIAVSADGMEIFFTNMATGTETLITTRFENGKWTEPEVAAFSGRYLDGFPSFHPDGSKLFFHSYRPLDTKSLIADVANIWYVEKEATGWSEPKPVGAPINGSEFVSGPSVTRTGTLYFCRKPKTGGEKVFRSQFLNGQYMEPEMLPDNVNCVSDIFHAVVSPDESYLIVPVAGRKDSLDGRINYYVSFRDRKGNWSDLINLGKDVNNGKNSAGPSISADGNYFFFEGYPDFNWVESHEKRLSYEDIKKFALTQPSLYKTDIFWVSAKIIEEMKPKELK